MSGLYRRFFSLSLLSILNGLLEAVFLVVLAKCAFTVANGKELVLLAAEVEITLGQALVFTAVLLLIRLITSLLVVFYTSEISYRTIRNLRLRLIDAYLNSSWPVKESEAAGSLQQLMVKFPEQAGGLVTSICTSVAALGTLGSMLLVALFINPLGTLLILCLVLFLSVVIRPIRKLLRRLSQITASSQVSFSNDVAMTASLSLELHTFGVLGKTKKSLADTVTRYGLAERKVQTIASLISPVYITLTYVSALVSLLIGSIIAPSQSESMAGVMLLMLRSLGYGQLIQQGLVAISSTSPAIDIVESAIEKYQTSRTTARESTLLDEIFEISFDEVNFSYRNDSNILRDFNFKLTKGEVIGVIGASGSGKSTFLQLILGLRETSNGSIKVNGLELSRIDRYSLSSLIAYVPQESTLLTGTVRENVSFFRENVSTAMILDSLETVGLKDYIETLPLGLDTTLGERGQFLSGGQRQRLSIARAIVNSPSVLILDEPTSSLDHTSESLLVQAIEKLKGSVTIVIVAHKLNTLKMCDRLMLIENGKITSVEKDIQH